MHEHSQHSNILIRGGRVVDPASSRDGEDAPMRGNAHEARSLIRPDFSLIRFLDRTLRMFSRGSLAIFDEYVWIIS